jgi:hypothetical protein
MKKLVFLIVFLVACAPAATVGQLKPVTDKRLTLTLFAPLFNEVEYGVFIAETYQKLGFQVTSRINRQIGVRNPTFYNDTDPEEIRPVVEVAREDRADIVAIITAWKISETSAGASVHLVGPNGKTLAKATEYAVDVVVFGAGINMIGRNAIIKAIQKTHSALFPN